MEKVEVVSKVSDYIRHYKLLSSHETIVVAVSGGADSVCLFHLLARLREHFDLKPHIAHLNHQLRDAESEADALYVQGLAKQFNTPITLCKQDVLAYKANRDCCLEEAARELRYKFFYKVAKEIGAKRVAIGHTLDDNVETVLMHILRGTGISGLKGLAPCSTLPYSQVTTFGQGSIHTEQQGELLAIRPLLNITREEALNYCHTHKLLPRADSSNLSLSFKRNRLRLELLPLLEEYNPCVKNSLLQLAEIARADMTFIEDQAVQAWKRVVRWKGDMILLDKRQTITLPVSLQRQVIRLAVSKIQGDLRDIGLNNIEAVRNLFKKNVGKELHLPHNIICYSEYNEIVISKAAKQSTCLEATAGKAETSPALLDQISVNIPGETILPGWKVTTSISQRSPDLHGLYKAEWRDPFTADLDIAITGTQLFVRNRKAGDRFQPLGMKLSKTLQNFMVDIKIPIAQRSQVPLLCSLQQVYWIVGFRIDDRVKITSDTTDILHVEFIRL